MHKRQVTLADLARELGISTATVSRALKDYPDISQHTKDRVLELARKLKYQPNSLAAGLRNSETRIIGVIVPEIVNHFFSHVIKGIMEHAYAEGYNVMLCQSDEQYEKEVEDAKALLASRVDGLLVSITHQTEKYDHFEDFIEAGIPVVFFDKAVESMKNTSRVIVDDRLGAFQAVEHLIGEGCRRIAHFTSPELSYTGKHRLQGYLDAHKRYGIPVDERLIRRCKVVEFEEGYRFALEMLSMEEPPDAIFAVTDEVALGAMTGLKGAGITIPDQVAVMGFSNWKLASVVEPPLSTIAQPGFRIGQESIKLLLKEIQELKKDLPVTYQTMVLPTELIIRESSRRQKTLVNVSNG